MAPGLRWSIAVGLFLSSAHATADATTEPAHWQLAPALMGGMTRVGPTANRNQIGTGMTINGIRDGAFPVRSEWDSGAGAALELGYVRGRLRLSGAFAWHFRSDWDLAAPTPSLATVTNVFTNVERAAWLLGAHYRWPMGSRWQLELGAGGGLVNHKLRTDYKVRAVPGVRAARVEKSSHSERNRALFAQAGVSYGFNPRLEGAVHYRYLDSGSISIRPVAESNARFRTALSDHLIVFSLRYRLQ